MEASPAKHKVARIVSLPPFPFHLFCDDVVNKDFFDQEVDQCRNNDRQPDGPKRFDGVPQQAILRKQ